MYISVGLDDHGGHGVSSGGLVLGEQDDLVRVSGQGQWSVVSGQGK